MQELAHSSLFEGPDSTRVFSHHLEMLEKRHYRLAGRLVAMSIMQGGPGIVCLHPILFTARCDTALTIQEITDHLALENSTQLKQVS